MRAWFAYSLMSAINSENVEKWTVAAVYSPSQSTWRVWWSRPCPRPNASSVACQYRPVTIWPKMGITLHLIAKSAHPPGFHLSPDSPRVLVVRGLSFLLTLYFILKYSRRCEKICEVNSFRKNITEMTSTQGLAHRPRAALPHHGHANSDEWLW